MDRRHDKYYDETTGLPNKTLFYDRLTQALALAGRRNHTLGVMFVSIENLKLINDSLGQSSGDCLLNSMARRIQKCLRKSDTVARPGRDEFMILLPEIKRAEDAAYVARKIFDSLNGTFEIGGQEFFVNANIGVSIYPGDGLNGAALIRNSYTAMLHSKQMGKNTYLFYSPAINDNAFRKMVMENGLRLALRRQEFVLHYQPQLDLATGLISGMEALVRWQRPEFGLVYPGDFINTMEETGLIVPMGDWVLRTACEQGKKWLDDLGIPVKIAINLSAGQFHSTNIIDNVSRTIEQTRLDPCCLELELTESIFMKEIETAVEIILKLKQMGIQISIDDFGTGYSSLSYLKYFPVNKLKMVEPFVSFVAIDPSDEVIARAIVAMAHSLNIKVIAEGVEKREHLAFVNDLSCDELQGNFFSRPLPINEAADFLCGHKVAVRLPFGLSETAAGL